MNLLLQRSILFSGVERYVTTVCFLVSTAILSRLLTPDEFGLYTAVVALTAVATACSQEFGGANYLIQKPALSEQDIRSAFTITFLMSALLGIGFFSLRNTVASFYSQEGLKGGITVIALGFLLLPFSATTSALLRREMAFGVLARCNLLASLTTAMISIGLVTLGKSYVGLLIGTVVGQVTLVVLLLRNRLDLGIFYPSLKEWRDVIGFGACSSAVSIINVVYQSLPQLILGRVLDFGAVGLYGRAAGVTQLFERLFIGVLSPVVMPAIALQTRAGVDLKRLYLQAVELLTAAQWPFLTFMALTAEPIVQIWFGPAWIGVVPLVRMLCLASLSLFAACLTYPILVVIGRVHDTLTTSLISLPPSLLVIFIASFFGVRAVAASALLTLPFQAIVAIYFISRQLDFSCTDLLRATKKSALVTACSCAGVMVSIVINNFSLALPVFWFFVAIIASLAGWCAGLAITGHPLLVHLCRAANTVFSAVPRPGFLRRAGALRSTAKV